MSGLRRAQPALIGRVGQREEQIYPGPHAYDGSYSELRLRWRGIEVLVQSAVEDDDLLLLVSPLASQRRPPLLVVEGGVLWNRPGSVSLEDGALVATLPDRRMSAFATSDSMSNDPYIATQTPYLALILDSAVGWECGR